MNKMPAKIKILLGAMLGAAVLIIAGFFVNLNGLSNLEANILQTGDAEVQGPAPEITDKNGLNGISEPCSDIDKDGLCDNEEAIYGTDPLNPDTDGDGFLDGEEVAAGCSPLILGANDCGSLSSNSSSKLNLTEYFSFLIAGSIPLEEKKLINPEVEEQIKSLSDEASRIKKTLLSIDNSTIKIETSKDNSKTASKNYLNELNKVLEKYFSEKNELIDVQKLDILYNELSELKPTPDLVNFHKKILEFFIKLRVYVANLSEEKEDPVKVLLTLDNTDNLLNEYEEIKTEIRAVHGGPSGLFVPVNDEVLINILHDIHEIDSQAREKGRETLHTLSDYIINVIRDMGRKGRIQDAGSNFFVQNFRNLGLEGQYRGENLWRGLLAIAAEGEPNLDIPPLLCKHIRESEAFRSLLPTRVSGTTILESGLRRSVSSLDDYLVVAKCDTFVDENYETFLNDFSQGGSWEMWEKMLQPQNNIFGAFIIAFDELDKQKKIEEQADINETLSGSGYLGLRQCLSFGPGGQCVVWGPAAIPSDLVVATLAGVVSQNLAYLADISRRDDAKVESELSRISEYFSNLENGLIPKIFGFEGF